MRVSRAVLILMAAILPACKVGPNFKPPEEPVPDQYAGVKAEPPQPSPQPSNDSASPSFWWREFHDPELDDLVASSRHAFRCRRPEPKDCRPSTHRRHIRAISLALPAS
jgi:hypothetical protein